MVKMGYQGVTLLLAAVIGIGFAAYQYYTQRSTPQTQGTQSGSHTYRYIPPSEVPKENPKKRRRSSAVEKCSICFEVLSKNIKTLKCKHSFHAHCIHEWFKESRSCPVCRRSV